MLCRAAFVIAASAAVVGCAPRARCATPAMSAIRPAASPPAAVDDHANEAIDALVAGNYAAVVSAFEPESEPPTAAQVETAWRAQTAGLGSYQTWSQVDRTFQDGFEVRILHIQHERGVVQCMVSVDPSSLKLRSLFITRPAPAASYIDDTKFHAVA